MDDDFPEIEPASRIEKFQISFPEPEEFSDIEEISDDIMEPIALDFVHFVTCCE